MVLPGGHYPGGEERVGESNREGAVLLLSAGATGGVIQGALLKPTIYKRLTAADCTDQESFCEADG